MISSIRHEGLVVEVIGTYWGKIRIGANPIAIYEEKDFKPIPLTEDWLLKFSFTHCMPFDLSKPFYFEKSGLKLVKVEFSNDGIVKKTGYVIDGLIGVCDLICTVHHLQNVFYFLTGEELQIIS
jgi:hypothetical protein